MANQKIIFGAIVANKYQCPTNMIKPKKCTKCGDIPVCKDFLPLADITGPVAGFKHSEYVEDPGCLAPVDGVVRLNKPIDVTAEGGQKALYEASCTRLMKYDVPEEDQINPDICTVVLECDIKLDVTDEGISHIGQAAITHLVLEDGTEIPFERLCKQIDVCSYQNSTTTEVTEADITAAVPDATNIVIETKTEGDVTVYTYTFDLSDSPLPEDVLIGGGAPALCGCVCEYVADEEATEEKEEAQKAEALKSPKKSK